MARTATKPTARATNKRATKPAAAKQATAGAKRATSKATKTTGRATKAAAKAAAPSAPKVAKVPGVSKLAKTGAKKAVKWMVRKALDSSAEAVRLAADRAADAGRSALDAGISKRLPIQVSVDVAVPLTVAWDEWMTFTSMTEGVHRIEDVERDGNTLFGRTAGPRSADWVADIVDERPEESFAWRSVEGSDVAGLATFHRLSERLTRIELDLDVLPTNPVQALAFSVHLAHRHAEAELRRFKARVEFINPDVYEAKVSRNGGGPENESDDQGPEQEGDE